MENISVKDVVLEKKMSEYSHNENNFVASQELTVTITLAEYRDLIEKAATRNEAIAAAEADKYTRNNENDRLKKEVADLKAELYEYQKKFDAARAEEGADQ